MIESQLGGGSIDLTLVQYQPTRRGKVLGPIIADIVFRRPQVVPIGGGFHSRVINRNQFIPKTAAAGLGQQLLNDHFRHFVLALAKMMMSNLSLGINEIEGRPIVVAESPPDAI